MRKKTIWSGMCATTVFVAAVAIGAQAASTFQPPPSQPKPPPSQTPQPPMTQPPPAPAAPAPPQARTESSDHKVTITGCLQAVAPSTTGAASPTGTSGTADAKTDPAAGDAKFLLTNVTPADPAGGASATAAAAPKTYRLIANEAALSPHVGKKLELTGTLDDQSSSTSSPGAASSDASAASGSAPKLKVESGKVIAPQCSQ